MTLNDLKDALLSVSDQVHHHTAAGARVPYIVWAEDGAGSIWADNKMREQFVTGTVDLFTDVDADPLFNAVQAALDSLDISYGLGSVQYEEDTKLLHYEWIWEMA